MFDDKVIVKFVDGSLLRGHGSLFFPSDPGIEVMGLDNRIHFVDLSKVFAVFFVRDFDGNPNRDRRRPTQVLRSWSHGRPVKVTLTNGEVIGGKTSGEPGPKDRGMFLHPIDPGDNNMNIFLPLESVKSVEDAADPEASGAQRPKHPALR
jgi:hypothetical protein